MTWLVRLLVLALSSERTSSRCLERAAETLAFSLAAWLSAFFWASASPLARSLLVAAVGVSAAVAAVSSVELEHPTRPKRDTDRNAMRVVRIIRFMVRD